MKETKKITLVYLEDQLKKDNGSLKRDILNKLADYKHSITTNMKSNDIGVDVFNTLAKVKVAIQHAETILVH